MTSPTSPAPEANSGLTLSASNVEPHPAGPVQHGPISQAERAFAAASTFFSGIMAISASQVLGAPLKIIDPEYFEKYMAFTKQSFGVLITYMTQWWSPTVVRISGDESMRGQLYKMDDGSLRCAFPERLVLMANHQLYTDWLYLWWVAYTNKMHGYIYIILKESLRKVPIIGWGCQFYNFIFLARSWEKDQSRFQAHLGKLSKPKVPMWLLIFPEGTNLSASTREKSKEWAAKNGIPDLKHQLLPRSTGLRFCLQQLCDTTEWLYDCTIAYEGIPPGMFGQDIFTLRSALFEGRPPKSVNMHWRRFKISDIPINNSKAFDLWLRNRWTEKDHFLEHFSRTGRFPAGKPWEVGTKESRKNKDMPIAKYIETQVKSGHWEEFLSIFAPITAFATVLFFFYGASQKLLLTPNGKAAVGEQPGLVEEATNSKSPFTPEGMKQILDDVLQGQDLLTPAAAQKALLGATALDVPGPFSIPSRPILAPSSIKRGVPERNSKLESISRLEVQANKLSLAPNSQTRGNRINGQAQNKTQNKHSSLKAPTSGQVILKKSGSQVTRTRTKTTPAQAKNANNQTAQKQTHPPSDLAKRTPTQRPPTTRSEGSRAALASTQSTAASSPTQAARERKGNLRDNRESIRLGNGLVLQQQPKTSTQPSRAFVSVPSENKWPARLKNGVILRPQAGDFNQLPGPLASTPQSRYQISPANRTTSNATSCENGTKNPVPVSRPGYRIKSLNTAADKSTNRENEKKIF